MNIILKEFMPAPNEKDMLILEENSGKFYLDNHDLGLPCEIDENGRPIRKAELHDINYLCITYLEHMIDEDGSGYYTNNTEYFPTNQIEFAKYAFNERLQNNPFKGSDKGFSIQQVFKLDNNIPL